MLYPHALPAYTLEGNVGADDTGWSREADVDGHRGFQSHLILLAELIFHFTWRLTELLYFAQLPRLTLVPTLASFQRKETASCGRNLLQVCKHLHPRHFCHSLRRP